MLYQARRLVALRISCCSHCAVPKLYLEPTGRLGAMGFISCGRLACAAAAGSPR